MGMERLQYHTIWAFDMMSDVNEFMKRHGIKYNCLEFKKDKIIIYSDDVYYEIMDMNKVPAREYKNIILPEARSQGLFKLKREYIRWIEDNYNKYDRFIFSASTAVGIKR